MRPALLNAALFLALLSVPLAIEVAVAKPGYVPGTAFAFFLYEPFPCAYIIAGVSSFLCFNLRLATVANSSLWLGAAVGLLWGWLWAGLTFIALIAIHAQLGGTL